MPSATAPRKEPSYPVSTRFQVAEFDEVRRAANEQGVSISRFIGRAAVGQARRVLTAAKKPAAV